MPDLVGNFFRDRNACLALGDVEPEIRRLAAAVADFLCGLGCGLLVDIEQHDARALARIARRNRAADAGGGAGDDGDVILEKSHGVSSVLILSWR